MAAPMEARQWWKTLFSGVALVYFVGNLAAEIDEQEFLLCRQCGHEVAKAEDLNRVPTAHALRQRNDTILNMKDVLIQLFENPHGRQFEVITSWSADVYKHDERTAAETWFPGFTWRIIACPRCGFHLGWFFESELYADPTHAGKSFVGLILENLLHRDYADSLLMTPKTYNS